MHPLLSDRLIRHPVDNEKPYSKAPAPYQPSPEGRSNWRWPGGIATALLGPLQRDYVYGWGNLQPAWRQFSAAIPKRPLPATEYTEGSWKSIRATGPNGLTSVVATLVYVARLLDQLPSGGTGWEKKDRAAVGVDLQKALDDVGYVFRRLLATHDD
ncbi:SERTA domain-containing protein 3 [Marasmius crinis-equi]|uniref:SERTA domain-containing protein 3 n=1 Tax=Marasmius crinis-equi TaxID=585013 RepID=A0ABR3EVV5_9AGAR